MKPLILIADDDALHRSLIGDTLRASEYDTLTADNGARAVELARSEKPSLILMDAHMPVLDGVSAVKLLKENEDTKAIPTIVITAQSLIGDRERLLDHGFDGYLSKPFSIKELRAIVASYLKARR